MVFDLASDFTLTLAAIPAPASGARVLRLLATALHRDLYYLYENPNLVFQCLHNSCWWHDSPECAGYYDTPPFEGYVSGQAPWERKAGPVMYAISNVWLAKKTRSSPRFQWVRSLRPPPEDIALAFRGTLRGRRGVVYSIAASPNGSAVAAGGGDTVIQMWDLVSGRMTQSFRGHERRVTCLAFSKDGNRLVSASEDTTVRVWDAHSGSELGCFRGHSVHVDAVAFSPDGRLVASGTGRHPLGQLYYEDKTIRLWDSDTREELDVIRGHESWIKGVAFTADGERLVYSAGGTKVYDIRHRETMAEIKSAREIVVLSPDGHLLASSAGQKDWVPQVFELSTGRSVSACHGHTNPVLCLAFSPDSATLATGSVDQTVRLWDVWTGKQLRSFRGHKGNVYSLCFSLDGKTLISSGGDETIRTWSLKDSEAARSHRAHRHDIYDIGFSPDGKRLITWGADGYVGIWDCENGLPLVFYRGFSCVHPSSASSSDGLIISQATDGVVRAALPYCPMEIGSAQQKPVVLEGFEPSLGSMPRRSCEEYRAVVFPSETRFVRADAGILAHWEAEALRFPAPLNKLKRHPFQNIWAGCVDNHLFLVKLEGVDAGPVL